jgi:hypothetical protein
VLEGYRDTNVSVIFNGETYFRRNGEWVDVRSMVVPALTGNRLTAELGKDPAAFQKAMLQDLEQEVPPEKAIQGTIELSREDVNEFTETIRQALEPLSKHELLYVHLIDKERVVISFSQLHPFLGHTRGSNNESKPERLPLEANTRVLRIIGLLLKRHDPRGGRVFVTGHGVYSEACIGVLQWPSDHPEKLISQLRIELLERAVAD